MKKAMRRPPTRNVPRGTISTKVPWPVASGAPARGPRGNGIHTDQAFDPAGRNSVEESEP